MEFVGGESKIAKVLPSDEMRQPLRFVQHRKYVLLLIQVRQNAVVELRTCSSS